MPRLLLIITINIPTETIYFKKNGEEWHKISSFTM